MEPVSENQEILKEVTLTIGGRTFERTVDGVWYDAQDGYGEKVTGMLADVLNAVLSERVADSGADVDSGLSLSHSDRHGYSELTVVPAVDYLIIRVSELRSASVHARVAGYTASRKEVEQLRDALNIFLSSCANVVSVTVNNPK